MEWKKVSSWMRWILIVLALLIIPSCSASCTWVAWSTYQEIQAERAALRQLWVAHQSPTAAPPQTPRPPAPPVP